MSFRTALVPLLFAAVTAGPAVAAGPAAGPYDNLLYRIPESANAIVLLDVQGLFSAPVARANRWAEDPAAHVGFTPIISRLALSAHWKPDAAVVPEFGVAQ